MSTEATDINDAAQRPTLSVEDLPRDERCDDDLIMHLERDQFVAETSRPVPRAPLSARASVGLWALRVFVVIVSLMVIYTFAAQLH